MIPGVWGCYAQSWHSSSICILLSLIVWPETAIYFQRWQIKHISVQALTQWALFDVELMSIHVNIKVFFFAHTHTHCIAHLSVSYKCWTFTLLQPTRLPSAGPGNQILPPRPFRFITESFLAQLNWVTSSHRSRKPPIARGFTHLSVLKEG